MFPPGSSTCSKFLVQKFLNFFFLLCSCIFPLFLLLFIFSITSYHFWCEESRHVFGSPPFFFFAWKFTVFYFFVMFFVVVQVQLSPFPHLHLDPTPHCISSLLFASDTCHCSPMNPGQSYFSMDTNSLKYYISFRFHVGIFPWHRRTLFFYLHWRPQFRSVGSTKVDPNALSQKVNLLYLCRAQGRDSKLKEQFLPSLAWRSSYFHKEKLGTVQQNFLAAEPCIGTKNSLCAQSWVCGVF